jgi:hypothetical protein
MDPGRNNWSQWVIPCGIYFLLALAMFSKLYLADYTMDMFFSSDALYLPSLYRDVIVEGHGFEGWHLNPAPNYFPDMVVYFLLMTLTGSFLWSTFIFAFVQYAAIGFLLCRIFKKMFPEASDLFCYIIHSSLWIYAFESLLFSDDLAYTYFLLINAYHTGAFVITLVCVELILGYLEEGGNVRLMLLFVLVAFASLSDRLFIVLFVVPLSLALLTSFKKLQARQTISLFAVIFFSALSGVFIFNLVKSNSYEIYAAGQFMAKEAIKSSWTLFSGQVLWAFKHLSFNAVSLYVFILAFSLYLFSFNKLKKLGTPQRTGALFFIFFTIVVLSFPVITGKYTGHDSLRYNIYPLFTNGFLLSLAMTQLFPRALTNLPNWSALVIVVILVSGAFCCIRRGGMRKYFDYYPEIARTIDESSGKADLKYGVANHWISKKATMFSRKGVVVRSVFDDLSFHDHVSSERWFYDNIFTFVVLNNFADTNIFRNSIRDPAAVRYDDTLKMIETSPFVFRRGEGIKPINLGYKR